jgi:hypothetical protein
LKKANIKKYRSATFHVILYGYRTWYFTLRKDKIMKEVINGLWKEHGDARESKELGGGGLKKHRKK